MDRERTLVIRRHRETELKAARLLHLRLFGFIAFGDLEHENAHMQHRHSRGHPPA